MPDYEYEFRDVPPVVRLRVADLVREGEQLLAENPLGLSPGQGVWMSHVESIIAGLYPTCSCHERFYRRALEDL